MYVLVLRIVLCVSLINFIIIIAYKTHAKPTGINLAAESCFIHSVDA